MSEWDDWIIETGGLARELGISKWTVNRLADRVNLCPYLTNNYRRAFRRSHLVRLVECIYFADNELRASTLATIFNSVFKSQKLTRKDFRKVGGRWVLR